MFFYVFFFIFFNSYFLFSRVLESNDIKYPVGSYVWSFFGWRDLTIFNNNMDKKEKGGNHIPPYIIEAIENIPLSTRLGVLGMTGLNLNFIC